MSIAPLTFTGVSTLSTDLQSVLTRAVAIASLPLKRLQNQDSDVLQKKVLLGGLTPALTDLGNAVAALGSIASKKAVSASTSNSTLVAVQNTGADASASYTIAEITSVARNASETSVISYADSAVTAVSATGSLRLVVGARRFDFDVTQNNLVGVRDKINSLGAGVTASILTTGAGRNYLSISTAATGSTTLQLIDDPLGAANNVLTANDQGANAEFQLNGIPISRSSNTVNDIVSGLTFTILGKTDPAQTVKLTLATDRSQLLTAIQSFATKYNAVATAVNAQVGPAAGLLSGDFLVRQVQDNLRSLGSYHANGTIKELSDVGINFDSGGKISIDAARFQSLSDNEINSAFQFFGSSTTGFGALAKKFTQLTDPVTGLIKLQSDSYDATDRRLQAHIADLTERINTLQSSLAARLRASDALLAQLESQQKQISASLQAANFAIYGKQTK